MGSGGHPAPQVVGQEALEKTTLRSLGLVQGKGLLRLMYKKPEVLKSQANVYDMKVEVKEVVEKPHRPMRLEAASLSKENSSEPEVVEGMEVEPEQEKMVVEAQSSTEAANLSTKAKDGKGEEQEPPVEEQMTVTSSETGPAPRRLPLPPHGALVYHEEEASSETSTKDMGDDFFELTIDEVKSLYRGLKNDVKNLEDGGDLLTSEMRSAREEGQKLQLLGQYKAGLVRIRLPCRHVVQVKYLLDY